MKRFFAIIFCLWGLGISPLHATDWKASLAEMPNSAMIDGDGNMTGAYVELIKAIDRLAGANTHIEISGFSRSLRNPTTGHADYHIPLIQAPGENPEDLPFAYSTETLFK